MRPLLKQMAELIGSSLRDALAPISAKTSALEARIAALEGKSVKRSKASGSRIVRSGEMPHEAPAHKVGDVVRVAGGGGDWECTGPNRWRQVRE